MQSKSDGLRKKVRQYREKLVDTGIQYNTIIVAEISIANSV